MGIAAGFLVGTLLFSVVAGFATFVLFAVSGALWRRDEIPVLPFCLAYQWLFATSGYLSYLVRGTFPGFHAPGQVDLAVFLSQMGLVCLAAGVRCAWYVWHRLAKPCRDIVPNETAYRVRRLFLWVVGAYMMNWFMAINPVGLSFNYAQIIGNLLTFRTVLLVLLLVSVVRSGVGHTYALAALAFALAPSLGSFRSIFGGFLLIAALALSAGWRPWERMSRARVISKWSLRTLTLLGAVLVVAALLWQGAVKYEWRRQIRAGGVSEVPVDRMLQFFDTAGDLAATIDVAAAADSLLERTSSGLGFFSYVVIRVPALIPHTNGELTLRALEHVSKPRFLFPDKPALESDSRLVRKYAGFHVAGPELNTSVGLGYMAEFYIDFGALMMFLPLFVYGLLAGVTYALCFGVSPSREFADALAATIFISHFMSYEGEIAKLLGGLLQTFLVFAAITVVLGTRLHRWLGGVRLSRTPFRA